MNCLCVRIRGSPPPQKKQDKKVLLRERKRHTDRGVSSTPICFPKWGTPLPQPGPTGGGGLTGGYPLARSDRGGTRGGVPPLNWGTPPPGWTWTWLCGQTDGWMDGRHVSKHYLPVVLRTRSVKIALYRTA